jgi:hypothetical protein
MNQTLLRRIARPCVLAALAFVSPARAEGTAPAHTIAVLSLVGDQIDVVTFQPQTGSLTETNRHSVLPFAQANLDFAALKAAKAVLSKADPGADIALLAASKPESYEPQGRMFDGDRVTLPPEIDAAVQREHATQLVLVTKYRTETRMKVKNGALGTGKLEGLGFYVDNFHRLRRSDTQETGIGFIAPYAYVELTLVDVAGRKVLRRIGATQSRTLAESRNTEGVGAWDVLSPQEKVEALNGILDRAVRENLPALLAPAAATP